MSIRVGMRPMARVVGPVAPPPPESLVLYPSDDAEVRENYPTSNFGWVVAFTAKTQRAYKTFRSFLKFDLSPLPSGAVIVSGTLRCYCLGVSLLKAGRTDVQARRVADDGWSEGTITWNNQKAYGAVEDTKAPVMGTWMEWNVTSWVQNEWGGDKIVSICLRCKDEWYDYGARWSNYRSKEYDGLDPELVVVYTV